MSFFSLEHGAAAERADIAFYSALVATLAALLLATPQAISWTNAAAVVAGLAGWTLLEYALHRFVLHGLPPFRAWHAAHHARPMALIGTPTVLSAGLFALCVFLPACLAMGLWPACALMLGVLCGYLAYAGVHAAIHRGAAAGHWLRRRQRWHARHHSGTAQAGCYGVTTAFWDHVFGSAAARQRP